MRVIFLYSSCCALVLKSRPSALNKVAGLARVADRITCLVRRQLSIGKLAVFLCIVRIDIEWLGVILCK